MPKRKKGALLAQDFWSKEPKGDMVEENILQVLGAVSGLPLRYWKPKMIFSGAPDKTLSALTFGQFPKKVVPGKTHPVFSMRELPDRVGFSVCPCTSKKPFGQKAIRFIKKGCRLLHKNQFTDRDSYILDSLRFNMPASVAFRLRFRGGVPDKCIGYSGTRK